MGQRSPALRTRQPTTGSVRQHPSRLLEAENCCRWYFDSTSEATNASLVVTLYNDGPGGFPQGDAPLPLGVSMTGSYQNGSLFAFVVPATNATVVNNANGISGVWESTGWSFTGTSLYEPNPTYVITANSPGMDVYGTITYQAVRAKQP